MHSDQRGCTALCYAISRSHQKKAELPNRTVTSLLDAFPALEREKYLIRRLQILMNPGKRGESGNVIDTFLLPVFSFFVRRVHGGLAMLLKSKVFDIVFQVFFDQKAMLATLHDRIIMTDLLQALKNQIGQLDYTVSILNVLAEVLNYCDCCVSTTNPTISKDDLYQSFLSSQCPKMCIVILKHSGMSNLRNIASPTFLPLFLVCPSNSMGRKWLQDHHTVLQPFYQKFMEFSNIKYNLHADDAHLKSVKKRVKNFKNLITKLRNGESIVGKIESHDNSESGLDNLYEKEDSLVTKKMRRKSKMKIGRKRNVDTATFKGSTNELVSKAELNKNQLTDQDKCRSVAPADAGSDPKIDSRKSSKSGYDPSDLFGLLATSRSTGSSDENEVGHPRSSQRLTDTEKEENRMKQVATAMRTIFSENNQFSIKDSIGLKHYLAHRTSDENIEPIKKDLSPALNYLQSLFEDLAAKHRKVWTYERINNYPDRKTPQNEDENVQLLKLKIVLSQLEEYYLNQLTQEWDLLMKAVRRKVGIFICQIFKGLVS